MVKCGYCGRENSDSQEACSGCGTPFVEPPLSAGQRANIPIGAGCILQLIGRTVWTVSHDPSSSFLAGVFLLAGTGLLLLGCTRYATSKGYPGWVGWVGVLSIFGLLTVWLMPARRNQQSQDAASSSFNEV